MEIRETLILKGLVGTPGGIRTPDLLLRSNLAPFYRFQYLLFIPLIYIILGNLLSLQVEPFSNQIDRVLEQFWYSS